MTSLGLYIHIPFCRSRCDYCGFYSIGRKPTDRYIDALTKEMDLKSPDFEDRLCDTVYLGGGTPSSLSEAQLTRLMKTLSQHFRISDTAEITMEMNPCDMSEDYLKNAMRAGVLHAPPCPLPWSAIGKVKIGKCTAANDQHDRDQDHDHVFLHSCAPPFSYV